MAEVLEQEYRITSMEELLEHPENPRKGDVEEIAASIKANGFYGSVAAQKSTGHVIVGNHRMKAAKLVGLDSIPVTWIDCDDRVARRILLIDNRSSDLAGYEKQALADILSEIAEEEGEEGLAGTGYVVQHLDKILNELETEANAGDSGPDLGEGTVPGAAMVHLQWGGQRVPLSDSDQRLLDGLLKRFLERTGSQYGFLHFLVQESHDLSEFEESPDAL